MAAQICEACRHKDKDCYCSPNSTCGGYEKRTMTRFEQIKLMDIDELSEWLNRQESWDTSPWVDWWDSTYCQNCESVMAFVPYLNGEHECSYCELNGKCKFFPEMSEVPDNKEMIKMWLESEVEI